jgi:hypothetical protein
MLKTLQLAHEWKLLFQLQNQKQTKEWKNVKLNSKQKKKKQITQKHKDTKRMAKKNLSVMILHPPLN